MGITQSKLTIGLTLFGSYFYLVRNMSVHQAYNDNEEYVVLSGDVMRRIDLEVSEILSITRVQEVACTRIADTISYHLSNVEIYKTPICVIAGKGNNGANAIGNNIL